MIHYAWRASWKIALVFILAFGTLSAGSYTSRQAQAAAGNPYIGEIALFPYNFAPYGWSFAAGQSIRITNNAALYSLLGTNYGGDGRTSFNLPNLTSAPVPDGMAYYIATTGIYPSREDGNNAGNAMRGEVRMFPYTFVPGDWLKLNGQQLSASAYPELYFLTGSATDTGSSSTFTLPSLASPLPNTPIFFAVSPNSGGVQSGNNIGNGTGDEYLGETIPFLSNMQSNWLTANGASLPITQYQALYSLLGTRFGGDGSQRFGIPNIQSNPYGLHYYMVSTGIYPSRDTFGSPSSLAGSSTVFPVFQGQQLSISSSQLLNGTGAVGVSLRTQALHGTVTDTGSGFIYRAASNYVGADSFTIRTYNYNGFANGYSTISINVQALLPPVVTGVVDQQTYAGSVTPVYDSGSALLNGAYFASGTPVTQEGSYTLTVVNSSGVTTVHFVIDHTPPIVSGVQDGGRYTSPPTITFHEGTVLLNNAAFSSGGKIETEGNYTLIATDAVGNVSRIAFSYYKPRQVTFDSAGGTAVSTQSLYYGDLASEPPLPTRTGYNFTGWYTDAAHTQRFDFNKTVIHDNLALYADWALQAYPVSFDTGGGPSMPNTAVSYGEPLAELSPPARTGYTFAGWYSDAAHTQRFNFQSLITGPTALYAAWAINRYTVTFDSNGGDPVSDQQLNDGSIVNEPAAPTRTGYDFTGWYTDAAHTHPFDFAQRVLNDNLHLYAGWTIQSYKVSFDVYAQAGVPDININYGGTIQRPADPVQAGHTFTGWYRDAARTQPFDFQALITGATTIYAGWDINRYHVSFDSNGGEPVSDQQLNYGNAVSEPMAPTRTGYTFKGWYSDTDLKHTYSFGVLPISGDVQLYAGWERNRYTVNFDTYGGTVVDDVYIGYGDLLTTPGIPTANRDGMIFAGWFADTNHNQPFDFSQPIVANVILYAKWALRVQQITFDTDGGTNVAGQSAAYGDRLSRPADPVRTGYDFGGWYSDAGHQQRFDFATDTATSDLTLHAKWTLSVYRILYDVDGGTAVQEGSAHYGDLLSRPNDPTRSGYTFTGWYADTAHSQPFTFADHRIIADLRVYAGWQVNAPTDGGNTGGNGGGQGSSSNGQSTIRSTNGRVIIPVGRAGEVRLGSGVLLEVPQGAAGQPLDIQVKLISTPAEGLASTVHTISPIYEFTKNMQDNFSVPVKLTLQYDPSSIQTGETVAVFYQTAEGAPWVQVEGGDVKGSDISVSVNHFTRFAVMAVQAASTDQGNTAPTNSATNGTIGNEGSAGNGTTNFSDIAGHWAADSIRAAATLGIAKGYADGTFHPAAKVTRAEFAVMLMRALPSGDQTVSDTTLPFADQASIGNWAKADIATAYKLGWIKGDANGTFRPNASITRAEMAVMISNALASSATKQQTAGTTATFGDQQQIPAWAQAAAASLKQQGLLNGRADGHFDPSASTTRAEAAQVLMNAHKDQS